MNLPKSLANRFFFDQNMAHRHKLTARVTISLLGTVGLAAVILVGFFDHRSTASAVPTSSEQLASVPVETIAIEHVDSFQVGRTFTGVVKAHRTSELGFERTGRLIAVTVEEGDRVEAGQILARLDTSNLKAKQRELQAERLAAEARLKELVSGPRSETIAAALAEVRDLQSQLKLARLNYRRRQELLKAAAVSREEFEQTELGVESAAARLDAANRRLEELQSGTRVEQIAAQRAVVAQLDAALENVAVDISESVLLAPFAGTISSRYIDEGTVVSPATPLLRLVEDGNLEAWIGLPVRTASLLKEGTAVEIEVGGQVYRTTTRAILPELDPATRTRMAIFAFEPDAGSAVPAQLARVVLDESVDASGFWLPTTSLTRGSRGLWSVLAAEEQAGAYHLRRRQVELLHTDGDRVLVRGTIAPGDRIVSSGAHRVVEGQRVEVADH